MILDQHGNPISADYTGWKHPELDIVARSAFRRMRANDTFFDQMQSRIVDERGNPVYMAGFKIGDTVEVKRPARFSA